MIPQLRSKWVCRKYFKPLHEFIFDGLIELFEILLKTGVEIDSHGGLEEVLKRPEMR